MYNGTVKSRKKDRIDNGEITEEQTHTQSAVFTRFTLSVEPRELC